MFEATRILFFYVETPLHAGTGRAMGAVDLPIQRERVTGYPIVQASSVKGKLRAEADPGRDKRISDKISKSEHLAIFGPETNGAHEHAGALSAGDAKLLLFPVRSLAGVFVWATSLEVLSRFARDLAHLETGLPAELTEANMPGAPGKDGALISSKDVDAGGKLVLEEFAFTPTLSDQVTKIGTWLAKHALPTGEEYAYWRTVLPKRLVILENDAFRDFTQFATEVQTHIKLDPDKKTVENGALWTEESLPADTLLYAPLAATPSRNGVKMDGNNVLAKITGLNIARLQLGGDETTGRGMVSIRFHGGK